MKRTAAFLLAVAICVGTTATAFATEETVKDSASTEFQFTLRNDPSYTITIPAHVTMEQEGTDVEVLAEDVQDLGEDQKISGLLSQPDGSGRSGDSWHHALSDCHTGRSNP